MAKNVDPSPGQDTWKVPPRAALKRFGYVKEDVSIHHFSDE